MTEETIVPKTKYEDMRTGHEKRLWLHKYKQWELGITDEIQEIRLIAYRALGFTEDALKDTYWRIRLEAYRALGWTEEALKDPALSIRLQTYQALGYTEEALNDKFLEIREEAEIWFSI